MLDLTKKSRSIPPLAQSIFTTHLLPLPLQRTSRRLLPTCKMASLPSPFFSIFFFSFPRRLVHAKRKKTKTRNGEENKSVYGWLGIRVSHGMSSEICSSWASSRLYALTCVAPISRIINSKKPYHTHSLLYARDSFLGQILTTIGACPSRMIVISAT